MILEGLRYYNTHPDKSVQRDPLPGTQLIQYLREQGYFDSDVNRQDTLRTMDAALEELVTSGEILTFGDPEKGGKSYRLKPNQDPNPKT